MTLPTLKQIGDAATRLVAPVPPEVADSLELLRYRSMQRQLPLLYTVMLVVVPLTMSVAFAGAPDAIRWGLPLCVMALCAMRLRWWHRQAQAAADVRVARLSSRRTILVAVAMALLCSVWTVLGWASSAPGERSFFPMFTALGTLSAAFCMSNSRGHALALLAVGLVPQIALLMLAGGRLDMIAAVILTVAGAFLDRLISQRHEQLIELLMLQTQMRVLAETDPLTGLANRRFLMQRLTAMLEGGDGVTVLLVDLDGFKAINDTHGHAAGDALLRVVAQRLAQAVGADGFAARLGGDEFAIVAAGHDEARAGALAGRLLTALLEPVTDGALRLRVGASLGYAAAPAGDRDRDALLHRADTRLYAAKRARLTAPAACVRGTVGAE